MSPVSLNLNSRAQLPSFRGRVVTEKKLPTVINQTPSSISYFPSSLGPEEGSELEGAVMPRFCCTSKFSIFVGYFTCLSVSRLYSVECYVG
jgi:hypothetical protein